MKYKEESPDFFNIAGSQYYFDLNELSQFIRIEKTESLDDFLSQNKKKKTKEEESEQESEQEPEENHIIDFPKWEMTKAMVECILNETGPVDEAMGVTKLGEQLTIPFRISFNTLLKYKIIKEQ